MRAAAKVGLEVAVLPARVDNYVFLCRAGSKTFVVDPTEAEPVLTALRNKDGQEIDFLVTREKKPAHLVEVKWADAELSPHFKRFLPEAPIMRTQVVGQLDQARSFPSGERIEPATQFLSSMTLTD